MEPRKFNLIMGGLIAGVVLFCAGIVASLKFGFTNVLGCVLAAAACAAAVRFRLEIAAILRLVFDAWRRRRNEAGQARQIAALNAADARARVAAEPLNREIRAMQQYRTPMQMASMRDDEFERFVLKYFALCGYQVEHTGRGGGDHGIDGILRGDGKSWLVQCKCYRESNHVGEPAVRDFLGAVSRAGVSGGMFVTSSTFLKSAREFASGTSIKLIDGEDLCALIRQLGPVEPAPAPPSMEAQKGVDSKMIPAAIERPSSGAIGGVDPVIRLPKRGNSWLDAGKNSAR